MSEITKGEPLEEQNTEDEYSSEEIETYQHFKKLDCWTLDEGLKLLIASNEIGQKSESMFPLLFDIEFLQNSKRYETVTRAINKTLTVEGNYEEKRLEYKGSNTEKTLSNFWNYCCARLEVNPFEFLEFIKIKNIFKIPSALEFIKKVNPSSGDAQYFWATDDSEDEQKELVKIDTPRETDNNDNVIKINLDDDKTARELKIALLAWKAIYKNDKGFNKTYGHIKNIENWLSENYPELSDSAINRICTVININKKGGALKTR